MLLQGAAFILAQKYDDKDAIAVYNGVHKDINDCKDDFVVTHASLCESVRLWQVPQGAGISTLRPSVQAKLGRLAEAPKTTPLC